MFIKQNSYDFPICSIINSYNDRGLHTIDFTYSLIRISADSN